MNTSTAKISNLTHEFDMGLTPKISNLIADSEVRSAALVWTIGLLGIALSAFIIFVLGIAPADLDLSGPP